VSGARAPAYPVVIARAGPKESMAAALFLAGGLFAVVVCAGTDQPLERTLLAAAVAAAGALWVAALALTRTTVFEDRVEQRSILGLTPMARTEVAAWRVIPRAPHQPPSLILFSRPPLRLFYVIDPNGQETSTWLEELPESPRTSREAVDAAMAEEPAFGPDAAARRARVQLLRQAWQGFVGICGVGAAIGVIFGGLPDVWLLVLSLSPLLAFAWALILRRLPRRAAGGAPLRLDSTWLVGPFMVVMMAGFGDIRSVLDHGLIDPLPVLLWGMAAAAPLLAATLWLDRPLLAARKPFVSVLVLVCAVLAGDGMIGSANRLFDPDPGRTFVTRINELHKEGSRYPSYHAVLAGWGGAAKPRDTTVPFDTYQQLREGERMCITQHKGALAFAWFSDRPC
jgi:hypothetical protein